MRLLTSEFMSSLSRGFLTENTMYEPHRHNLPLSFSKKKKIDNILSPLKTIKDKNASSVNEK